MLAILFGFNSFLLDFSCFCCFECFHFLIWTLFFILISFSCWHSNPFPLFHLHKEQLLFHSIFLDLMVMIDIHRVVVKSSHPKHNCGVSSSSSHFRSLFKAKLHFSPIEPFSFQENMNSSSITPRQTKLWSSPNKILFVLLFLFKQKCSFIPIYRCSHVFKWKQKLIFFSSNKASHNILD